MKHGDIRTLGACGYLTPLLSTILLLIFGKAALSWTLALSAVLIAGGALLAAKDLLFRGQDRDAITAS